MPWHLVALWFFYFLSLPGKGVLFLLTQVLILLYVIAKIKPVWLVIKRHKPFVRWQLSWAMPLILVGLWHVPLSTAPQSLAGELLQFTLRVFSLSLALMLTVNQQRAHLKTLLVVFVAAMLVHSLSAYWQWYSGWDFTHRIPINEQGRLSGSIFNPNPFGLFMALALALVGYLGFVSRGIKRYAYLLLLIMFGLSLLKSESRGALFGVIVAMLVTTLSLPYSRTWRWSLVALKLMLVGGVAWSFSQNLFRPGSDDIRWDALQQGIARSFEHPWIGCSWECTRLSAITPGANGVHNVFLDIALLSGWPSALLFIGGIIWLFYVTRKSRDALSNTLRAMLALLLAAGLFDYSVLISKMYLGIFVSVTTLLWLSAFMDDKSLNSPPTKKTGAEE